MTAFVTAGAGCDPSLLSLGFAFGAFDARHLHDCQQIHFHGAGAPAVSKVLTPGICLMIECAPWFVIVASPKYGI